MTQICADEEDCIAERCNLIALICVHLRNLRITLLLPVVGAADNGLMPPGNSRTSPQRQRREGRKWNRRDASELNRYEDPFGLRLGVV